MQITQIEIHKVIVPMRPGTVHSPEWGKPEFDEVPKFILKVHTDTEHFGIGETYRGLRAPRSMQQWRRCSALIRYVCH